MLRRTSEVLLCQFESGPPCHTTVVHRAGPAHEEAAFTRSSDQGPGTGINPGSIPATQGTRHLPARTARPAPTRRRRAHREIEDREATPDIAGLLVAPSQAIPRDPDLLRLGRAAGLASIARACRKGRRCRASRSRSAGQPSRSRMSCARRTSGVGCFARVSCNAFSASSPIRAAPRFATRSAPATARSATMASTSSRARSRRRRTS